MGRIIHAPVDPVMRIPDEVIDDKYLVQRGLDKFGSFERDRSLWLRRREKYYLAVEDFETSTRKGLWDGSCFLPGTDLLTKRGWVPVEAMTLKDHTFSRNPKTGELGFIPVKAVMGFGHCNNAVHFHNKRCGLDITVTDIHRMYLVDERGGAYKNRHKFVEAKDMVGKKVRHWGIPRNGIYSEGTLPLMPENVDPFDWFELWGWYLSEGCACKCCHSQIEISQSKSAKPENYKKIEELLKRLPFKYSKGRSGNYFRISIDTRWRTAFASCGLQPERVIPRPLLNAPSAYLKVMYEAMMLGDGTKCRKSKHRSYATSSKRLASDVQEVMAKVGVWGIAYETETQQGKPFYIVSERHAKVTDLTTTKIERTGYTGKNFCVTNEWGVVYARQNGKPLFIGQSNLHFPLTEIQCNALHALIMQAVFFRHPWFYIDPQEEDIDVERVEKIERFMKYVLERYANYHKGIYLAVDDWATDLTRDGVAIFSRGWEVVQHRFRDIVRNEKFDNQNFDFQKMFEDTPEEEFDKMAREFIKEPYREQSIIRTVFNGPTVVAEDPAFVLFKGDVVDCTDLNEHETVIKVCYFSKEQLIRFRDSEYMDSDAVNVVLESGGVNKATSSAQAYLNTRRAAEDFQTGINTTSTSGGDTYECLVVYDSCSLNGEDNFSVPDRLQYIINPNTNTLMRWTYLDRISSNGKIPLHMCHLFRRPRRSIGRGMVQTMFNLNDSLDVLVNQSIDAGTLANNPMFGFKGDSTWDPQEVRVEPGLGIKMEDPKADINFFSWNVNPSWSQAIQGGIISMAERMTAIGPTTVGQVGQNVGPLRSTSGVQALGQNANMLHDVWFQRVKSCMSELFEGLYSDCTVMMPPKLKISVTGAYGVPMIDEDGKPIKMDISRDELARRVHFGIYANGSNLNKDIEKQNAMEMAQFSFQPLPIQTGVIKPQNVYEIMMEVHRTLGTARAERFVSKPDGYGSVPMEHELRMIMQGIPPPVGLNDPEREGKIEMYSQILDSPAAELEAQHGIVSPNAMSVLKNVLKQHKKYFEVEQQPSNLENPTGSQQSPTMGLQGGQTPPQQDAQVPRSPDQTVINPPQGGDSE